MEYKQSHPPAYPLGDIKGVPIAVYAGKEDELADVADVEWFRDQVKDSVVDY